MAYSYIDSTQPATGGIAAYAVLTKLMAQGWTKKMDSDGTTYSSTGVQVTSGATGAGGLNNTNAWVRMQAPDGVREFIWQRTTASTTWRHMYSASAKFTGGSPGATRVSTSTDQQILMGSGTDAAPVGTVWFGTDNTYRQFAGAEATTPYPWWMVHVPNGGGVVGTPGGCMIWDPVVNAEPTDADQIVIYAGAAVATMLLEASLTSEAAGPNNVFRGYLAKGLAGEGWTTICGLAFKTASRTLMPNGAGANAHSAKEDGLPICYGRPSAIAPPNGYKGFSRMMRWNGSTKANGDTLTVSTSRDRIILGDVTFPWGGTVPTL